MLPSQQVKTDNSVRACCLFTCFFFAFLPGERKPAARLLQAAREITANHVPAFSSGLLGERAIVLSSERGRKRNCEGCSNLRAISNISVREIDY